MINCASSFSKSMLPLKLACYPQTQVLILSLRRLQYQAAQCSLVQNIYFGLQKIGSVCPKIREK